VDRLFDIFLLITSIDNWWDIPSVLCGLKSGAVLKYKNGFKLPCSKGKLWDYIRIASAIRAGVNVQFVNKDKISFNLNGITFQKELNEFGITFLYYAVKLYSAGAKFTGTNNLLLPNNITFSFDEEDPSHLIHIYETFFDGTYDLLDVKGKVVVDVGANIGDTPVYFASKDALRVHAYEPAAQTFPYLTDNIKLNNLVEKIFPFNVAITPRCGRVLFFYDKRFSGSGTLHPCTNEAHGPDGYWVNAETLPQNADVLKMDCEGLEYDILLNLGSGKLKFKEIIIEFHNGSKVLKDFLEKEGYTVKIVKQAGDKLGILYAKIGK
jgi:FkbM family methyltransferase